MSTATPQRLRTQILAATAIMLLCSGCIMQGDVSANAPKVDAPTAAETPQGVDFSGGGQCEPGQDIFINGQGLEVEVSGACGNVRVEGADLTVAIANAESISIRGEHNTVEGETWDTLLIQGATLKAQVKTAGSVEISGKDVTFESDVSNALLITGDSINATTGDTRSIDITGANNEVNAAKVTDFIVVDGVKNTVKWTDGIEKENASAGEDNTFKRP